MRRGDSDFYKRLGRSGGMKTNARHGRDFYSRIGKRGGARVAQLAALGRRAEAEKEDER